MTDSSQAHESFEFEGLSLAYNRYGTGPRVYLALHGYGQTSTVFKHLPDTSLTVYAIDLPFHGESTGTTLDSKVKEGLQPDEFIAWVHAFLNHHNVVRYTLVGYSMGGRLALCLCQGMIERIDAVKLVAPDGFNPSLSYQLTTTTALGRAVFKRLPYFHGIVQHMARLSKGLGFIDQRLYRLVTDHTADKPRSEQLYKTWTYLRHLHPDLKRLADDLALESIELIVHLGVYDTIIPKGKVLNWSYLRNNPERVKMHDLGHRLLVEAIFEELRLYQTT